MSHMTEEDVIPRGKKRCECGKCNEFISLITTEGKPARFKLGHNVRLPEYRAILVKHQGRGERHYNWSGGKTHRGDGYVMVNCPGHPRADRRGRVMEHIVIMEQMIGRRLQDDEVVHHKNKNRSDNRPENLKLFSSNGLHLAEELTIDMSNRRCYDCGSNKTHDRHWYLIDKNNNEKLRCSLCYMLARKSLSSSSRSDMEASSNSSVHEHLG
jgi:hypothetical protein